MKKTRLVCLLAGLFFVNLVLEPSALCADAGMSTRNRIKIRKKSKLQPITTDDSQEYSLEKMELLSQKRRGLILDIKRFIREAKAEDQKAELNLRLGALYMEDYHSGLAKAQQIYERDLATYEKEKNKKKRAPKLDNSEALASLDKARAIYRDLINRYPQHARRDEMYYFLALSSLDKGRVDEGMGYFKSLSESMPNSRYVNDALVQLGDYYFEANNFPQADNYYNKIIQKKHRPLIPYATYKKAWCAYNGGNQKQALQLFKWVIEHEDTDADGPNSAVRIKTEALKDITLPFVDLKVVEEAIAFFKAHGDPHYKNGIETMASLYFEAGEYKNSITLWEHLLAADQNGKKNPTYEISIIEAMKLKHEDNAAVERLFARLPNYTENSNWYEINSSNPQTIKEAVSQFEETAWKYAIQYHAEAQRTKNQELYTLARNMYAKYLESFPTNVRAPKVRFQLAEILYKQARYVEASDHYYKVFKDPSSGELKYDAVRAALMSLDRQLNLDRKKLGLAEITSKNSTKLSDKSDTELEFVPYGDVENRFLTISEEYLAAYPQAKDAADVLYEGAYIQYLHHDFQKSYKSFWTVVNKYSPHETAYSSSHLILDILNRKKDFEKLVAACKKILETNKLSRATFRTDVAQILRHGDLKRIQGIEEKGEFREAAEAYIEYTKAYGHQDEGLFEKALYNASVDYTKAEMFLMAVETQEKFLRRFPKSELRENLLLQVAKSYELLANFEKAAYYFEQFVSLYPKNVQVKSAMRLSGLYYWGSGNTRKAENVMWGYRKSFPEDRKLIERDILDLYESQGASDKLIQFYLNARAEKGVLASDYVAYSLKIAEIQAQRSGHIQGKIMEEALRTSQKYAKDMTQTPKGVEALSKIWFWYANQRESNFYNIRLTLPQRQLEINLQKKLALLKEVEKDYSRVASFGSGEWGLASIYRTALAYRTLAQDILQAPVPAELSAEQIDLYRGEINKTFIKPFNEKALNLVAQCLDKSQEFNLLSNWTPLCYSLAGDLDASRYPKVRTFYLPPHQLAVMVPNKNKAKITLGNLKNYAYPFFSFGLFTPTIQMRATASGSIDSASLYGERPVAEAQGIIPTIINYRVLSDERKTILASATNSERPSDPKKGYSFAFLNLLRLTSPQRAMPLLMDAIQRDPQNEALHNLLGLTHLELGNYPAAKVTWSAMVARGVKNAALWNNLGVVSSMEGRETLAMDYFSDAALMETPKEALTNLGFLALKYRNGFEAKKHFERSLQIEKSEVTAQVGHAVALVQNREFEASRDELLELSRKYKTDPFARLSASYFLVDVEKENEVANRLLWEYMDAQGLENDPMFRTAVQETKRNRGVSGGSELPDIQ